MTGVTETGSSELETLLNWLVRVCDHVPREYHVEKTKPDALTPMCVHCTLHENNNRQMLNKLFGCTVDIMNN